MTIRRTEVITNVIKVIIANNSWVSFISPAAPAISAVKKLPVSQAIRAESVPNIKSIKTTTCGFLCAVKPSEGWMSNGVFVELYKDAAASVKIGTVYYGHIKKFTITNNTVYKTNINGMVLGTIPSTMPPACDCYSLIHVHMTVGTNGSRNGSLVCNSKVSGSTTSVFSFVQ